MLSAVATPVPRRAILAYDYTDAGPKSPGIFPHPHDRDVLNEIGTTRRPRHWADAACESRASHLGPGNSGETGVASKKMCHLLRQPCPHSRPEPTTARRARRFGDDQHDTACRRQRRNRLDRAPRRVGGRKDAVRRIRLHPPKPLSPRQNDHRTTRRQLLAHRNQEPMVQKPNLAALPAAGASIWLDDLSRPHADEDLNRRQTERLTRLSVWLHDCNRLFLFEVLVPATPGQLQWVGGHRRRYDAQIRPRRNDDLRKSCGWGGFGTQL